MPYGSLRNILLLLPVAILFGGCLAVGQSFDLASVVIAIAASGAGSIGLGVLDRRESVRNRSKDPWYVGSLRGGFGNPFNVSVRGKVPLAEATAKVIEKSLVSRGFSVNVAVATDGGNRDTSIEQLKATGSGKSLLITIDKWRADTYINVGMHYLITATILDSSGNLVAEHSVTGEENGMDNLRGSVMNPAGYAKKAVPKAFADQFEKLLNEEKIKTALQTP